eukprot:5843169-Heterocapsa_arctica.AAC.1
MIRPSRAVRAIEKIDEQLENDIFGQTERLQPREEKKEKLKDREKIPEELAKAEKSHKEARSSDKIQEALAETPRT